MISTFKRSGIQTTVGRIILPVLVTGSSVLASASVIKMSLEDLTRKASIIVVGRVTATAYVQTEEGIMTRITVGVTERIKGEVDSTVIITQPGGRSGQMEMKVSDTVPFKTDEEVFVFLWTRSNGQHRVLGLSQGKLLIETSDDDKFVHLSPEPGKKTGETITLSVFIQRIKKILASG